MIVKVKDFKTGVECRENNTGTDTVVKMSFAGYTDQVSLIVMSFGVRSVPDASVLGLQCSPDVVFV